MFLPAWLTIGVILAAALAGRGDTADGPAPHPPAPAPPDVAPVSAVPFPSAPAAPSASPFAPRPVELPLSGISDPRTCSRAANAANSECKPEAQGPESDGPTCSWSAPPRQAPGLSP